MSFSIYFLLLRNSYGMLDMILTGDGQHCRIFRKIVDVQYALESVGVPGNEVSRVVEELNRGYSSEVSVSPRQYTSFYSLVQ
jgi:hypothetical protein